MFVFHIRGVLLGMCLLGSVRDESIEEGKNGLPFKILPSHRIKFI